MLLFVNCQAGNQQRMLELELFGSAPVINPTTWPGMAVIDCAPYSGFAQGGDSRSLVQDARIERQEETECHADSL